MKKALIYLTTLCCSAGAAPYYLPSPAGGALTPYDWQPTWRLDALYAIGDHHTPDTAGFRTGLELYNNRESGIRHQFGIGTAPQWGTGHHSHHGERLHQKLCTIPLTLGYTLNLGLTDHLFLFLGGKAGWALGHYKERSTTWRESESCHGFHFSAGGGLKVQCSDRTYFHLGYDFARTYSSRNHESILGQHILSAGFEWQF